MDVPEIDRNKACAICDGQLVMEIVRLFPDGTILSKVVLTVNTDYPTPEERINDVWCENCGIKYRIW